MLSLVKGLSILHSLRVLSIDEVARRESSKGYQSRSKMEPINENVRITLVTLDHGIIHGNLGWLSVIDDTDDTTRSPEESCTSWVALNHC